MSELFVILMNSDSQVVADVVQITMSYKPPASLSCCYSTTVADAVQITSEIEAACYLDGAIDLPMMR